MTDFFRSAFNYVSSSVQAASGDGPGSIPASSTTAQDHNLVGQFVEVGGLKLKIRSLIAEGIFLFVSSLLDSA